MNVPITNEMIDAGVKHLRLARDSGCGEEEDKALVCVIYTAMYASRDPEAAKLEMLVETLKETRRFWVARRLQHRAVSGTYCVSVEEAIERIDAALGAANTPEQQT